MAQEAAQSGDGSEAEHARAGHAPTKVIYLMGAGRSGSTILGVALGNCDGVFYAGELDKWLPRAGVPPLPGEERARFWAAVHERVHAEDLFGHASRALERSSLIVSPAAWRARRRLRARYREIAAHLLAAVSESAGAELVVDSSHYPLRARELQRTAGIELYLVFLVRDPQAVVASLAREDVPERSYGELSANAYLLLTQALSAWVFLRQPRTRRLIVRHEQFLADPRAVLAAILSQSGTGAPPEQLGLLHTGPVFQGNRLVRGETVVLNGAPAARARRSLLTALLQWPLQALIGRLSPAPHADAPVRRPREGART